MSADQEDTLHIFRWCRHQQIIAALLWIIALKTTYKWFRPLSDKKHQIYTFWVKPASGLEENK